MPGVLPALLEPGDQLPDFAAIFRRPAWHRRAACRGMGTDVFFPPHGETAAAGRAICATCQVRPECMSTAIEGDEAGVWAGTSERERRRPRRASA